MTTMRAIGYTAYGGPEVTQAVTVPKPAAGAGEVLIKVSAAGLNPIDIIERGGREAAKLGDAFPLVAGNELCGVVEGVGSGVDFKAGDKVMARVAFEKMGALGEYVAVDAGLVARAPQSLAPEVAAGIPLAGLTAWQALDKLAVAEGDHVLITGASGGVGLFAIQLAKARGAKVTVTASPAGKPYVDKAGADAVIDYRTTKLASVAQRWDKVLDLVGQPDDVFAVTNPGGSVVTTVRPKAPIENTQVTHEYMAMKPNGAQLAHLADLVDTGKLHVFVDSTYGIDQFKEAFARVEARQGKGKVIVKVA